jgi:alpha-mannosidase
MLKHTDLTRRRVERFLQYQLTPRRLSEKHGLQVEFNPNPCATQAEAEKGPWKVVEPGFKYGPAYKVFWFRITGTVPTEMAGKETVLIAEVGGERTVWRNNSPWCGIDVEHSDFGWLEGKQVSWEEVTKAGAPVLEYIQAYSRNAQTTVYGKEQPREELVEEVKEVALAVLDRDVADLAYDLDFGLSLLGTLEENDPAYLTLLRAMNETVNVYEPESKEALARGRKLLKDALGSLNGEFKHTLYPVGHAHLDTAWLWPLDITRLKMAHTTANQLRLLERYPEYHFVHSQASQYEWLETEYPGLFDQVKAAIDRGQWEPVGSMWVEADCNLTGGEALVRQFLYGRRYFRDKLGFETKDMWLPDVFGYSAALPQILAKFNISYFLTQKISWNQFNKFPHHTFWWQGIDGTRVWTHFPPADTYNGSCEPKEVVYAVKNYKDHARADQSLYLFGHGDGGGGPTERHLELLRRGRLAPSYPEITTGKSAKDFFREARLRSRDLMTWVGELYLELHRGTYTSQAANKHSNRFSEFLLRDAEWLASFAGDLSSYPAAELEAAWKLVLLNQFHDIIPGSSVNEVYVDSARDYETVRVAGEAVIDSALKTIGSKLDSSAFSQPVVFFQNTSVPTEGSVAWSDESVPASLTVGDEVLPVQEVEFAGERKLVFPTPTAALGSVAVGGFGESTPTSKYRLKASNRRIENGQFAVRFDPNGNITSLESLEDGTEFIEPGRLANLFQLFDDHPLFWSAWDVDAFAYEKGVDLVKSESFEIVERGPVRVAAEVVKRFGKSTIRQRISLGPTPGVRFDTWIDWHEEDKLLKVAFPVNVLSPRATYEIQFGSVERPTHVNTSWDMAKFEVCAQKWVDLSEADQGVALLNDGKYGHDVRGNVLRMSLLRAPKAPDPECDMGEHRFTYVLLPHFGPFNHAGVVSNAYALNSPLRSAMIEPSEGLVEGSLPPFITCDDRNIVIETVKKSEDGQALIVRLYECHNARGSAELSCARPILGAELCDMEENPIEDLELTDGQVSLDYKPFEIITIKLTV